MYPDHLNKNSQYRFLQSDIFDQAPYRWSTSFLEGKYSIGMHEQDFFEINIVLNGQGCHYIGSHRVLTERGDVFFIPPHIPHGYASLKGLDVYHLLLHEEYLRRHGSELQSLPYYFTLFNIEPVMRIGGNFQLYLKIKDEEFCRIDYLLERLLNRKAWGSEEAIMHNSCALMLIIQLCAIYATHYPQKSHISHPAHYGLDFMKSISEIYENYHHKLTINDLAEIAHQSRNSYIASFKKIMHTTPANFLIQLRLSKAKELLGQSDLVIAEIAQQTGFHDAPHLERTFKKTEHCTPVTYRKNMRGGA